MATAGDGRTPYQTTTTTTTGAGGKLRKKPHRRNIPATPYDRPPTSLKANNPNTSSSLLTKIVDPASRLISAGANRLFDVFRKRIPSLQAPPEINEEPQNVPPVGGQNGNFAANGISDVEQMLQEKTFTRSEIQRLTALLHSRTTESPSDDAVERERAKLLNSPSSLLRREASTSGSLKKYGDERDNLYATISTPIVSPRVREEITSPAELAKAYMGTRSTNVSPLFDSSTGLAKTPTTSVATKTLNNFRNLENGFATPRSRGRSAMYNMARTPYPRSPSVYTQKGTGSNYGQSSALTFSQSAFGQERKMALKRRSSVLDDDIGSGGVLRRTRQKANLSSQRDKRELGYTASQQPDISSQKLLLTNGPEENGSGLGSGYGFVPTKSTQTATKILQQLEKPSPKERSSGSSKSPTKLTLDMLHGQALRSLEKVDSPKLLSYPHDTQKTEVRHNAKLYDNRELMSKGKEKVEENGSTKFPIPRNIFTSVNGDLTLSIKDNAPIVTITDSPSKVPAESSQKKRAFQMTAPEDTFEMDDDDEVPVNNGHLFSPLVENKKPETSLVSNKPISADVIETLTLPEPSGTPALVENNKPVFLEVTKVPEQTEVKETENSSSLKTVKFVTSPPSTTTTEPLKVPQSPLQMDKVAPEKESNLFSLGKTAENASPFKFSANEPSEVKPDATSDPKAVESTSVFSSVAKDNNVKFALPNKEENGNEKVNVNVNGNVNGNGKLESLFSAAPVAASKSDGFLFGNSTNTTSTANMTPASNAPTFPSFVPSQPSSGANTTSFFNNTSPSVTSASTTTTTTSAAAANTIFSSSVPAPIFSFGSTTPKTAIAEIGNTTNATNDKEVKPNASSSPFAVSSFSTSTTTTTASGSSLFGFSVPAATSTTTGTQANPQVASTAVTQSVPFAFGASSSSSLFGSSTPAFGSSTPAFGSSTPALGSSTPAFGSSTSFGVSSIAASSEVKSDNSTSGPVFGSTWPAAPQSSGFGSTFASSPFSFGAASSTPAPSTTTSPITFGSSFTAAGATNSSFATPQSKPLFGNPTPLFGASTVSPNNNDQMSMEDSMAEDSMQTPSPVSLFGQAPAAAPVSSFGQAPAAAPGFMFGSATPTPTQPPAQAAAPGFTFGSATPTPTQPPANAGAPGYSFGSATPNPTQPPANAGAPGFSFGSATPTPTQSTVPFQFGGQPNQTQPQNPFQSSSVEFNGGGGSFSLGSTDKSGRRIVKVKNKNRSRKQ